LHKLLRERMRTGRGEADDHESRRETI
jgi:hypothetical protein